jgi:prevent-host-death family protein
MKTVNIAELRARLSAYLQAARGGEEIIVRDRNLPVAKLVPFTAAETSSDELALAAAGKLALPESALDQAAFWTIGPEIPKPRAIRAKALRAVAEDREE